MKNQDAFDFWYAVNNTEVLVTPPRRLETFGETAIDYRLVTEMMDSTDKVRIREGRLHAYRPRILSPNPSSEQTLEGFGDEEAASYLAWLREHAQDLMLLQYGFRIRKEGVREEIVTDRLEAVLERVKADMKDRDNPLAALLVGVDEPWEVCLVKLMVDLVQRSAPHHMRALQDDPTGDRHDIEGLFRKASRNPELIPSLADRLKRKGWFEEYQDRFFALVRAARRG